MHQEKQLFPIIVTDSGTLKEVNAVPSKIPSGNFSIGLRIVAELKLLQPQKQSLSIDNTDSGMVTEVRAVHRPKQFLPMSTTDSGMTMEAKL